MTINTGKCEQCNKFLDILEYFMYNRICHVCYIKNHNSDAVNNVGRERRVINEDENN